MAYAQIMRLLPKGTFEEYKADLKLELKNPDGSLRSTIQFRSGDNESSLRGFAVNFVVIDEAARIKYEAFVSVMTTLTQTRGRAIIISTPKGRGWFYDVYQRGEKFIDGYPKYEKPEDDPWREWMSIRMPTWTNPHVPIESIREAKKNLPEDVFQQEYAAKFLDDSAGVFRGVRDCIKGVLQPPQPGSNYVMGVDLANLRDFSVLTVMDRHSKHVVAQDRFNQLSWEIQYARIIELARRYNNAYVLMDSTGIGDPILETLKHGGIRVEGYKIGGSTAKQQLIEKLRVNIETGKISFPRNLVTMRDELECYEFEVSDSGVCRYSAPQGKHDDCVISLALAVWAADAPSWVYTYSNLRGI